MTPDRQFKLCANLPYNIATPVLSNLLSIEPWPVLMAATIQKELADRIVAGPRSKDYRALSIWIQSQCDVTLVRVMPPEAFWPRPKVHSAIVQIRPLPAKRDRIPDRGFFHDFVRAMFFHRRKFLRANLVSAFKERLTKEDLDGAMAELELHAESLRRGIDGRNDAAIERRRPPPPERTRRPPAERRGKVKPLPGSQPRETAAMKFVEMTGRTLKQIVTENEVRLAHLEAAGVIDEAIVRINEQGDIEIRRPEKWDVIGGLLGGFEDRIRSTTGLEWI